MVGSSPGLTAPFPPAHDDSKGGRPDRRSPFLLVSGAFSDAQPRRLSAEFLPPSLMRPNGGEEKKLLLLTGLSAQSLSP